MDLTIHNTLRLTFPFFSIAFLPFGRISLIQSQYRWFKMPPPPKKKRFQPTFNLLRLESVLISKGKQFRKFGPVALRLMARLVITEELVNIMWYYIIVSNCFLHDLRLLDGSCGTNHTYQPGFPLKQCLTLTYPAHCWSNV